MNLTQALNTRLGATLISVLLGLGLASLFRKACKGNGCVVVQAPDAEEVKQSVYRLGGECYKYTPHIVPCKARAQS